MGTTPSWDLWQSSDLKARAELQYRLSFPFAIFAFTLVSVPLARQLPRQGVYGRLIFAVILYAAYMNLQSVSENWMAAGKTPAWMGTWWLPVTMAWMALLLTFRDSLRFAIWRKRFRRTKV